MQMKINGAVFSILCLMLDFICFSVFPFCVNSFSVSYIIWFGLLCKPSVFSLFFQSAIWIIGMEFFSNRGVLLSVFLFMAIFFMTGFFRKNINTSMFLPSFSIWLVMYFLFVMLMFCPAVKFINASFFVIGAILYLFVR